MADATGIEAGFTVVDTLLTTANASSYPGTASKGSGVHESGSKKQQQRGRSIREIPWRAMFTHPTTLTLFLNNWTFGWIGYMVLTELPSYLTDVLGEYLLHYMRQRSVELLWVSCFSELCFFLSFTCRV